MKRTAVAMIIFQAIMSLRKGVGQDVVTWFDAPDETKKRYIAGVNFHTESPEATAEDGHNAWLARLPEDHPEKMVMFEDLGEVDKAERELFVAISAACNAVPQEEATERVVYKSVESNKDIPTLPVKYIGFRPTYRDGVYGTRIVWNKDETIMVPEDKARQMYRHTDVWVPGDAEGAKTPIVDPLAGDQEKDKEEEKALDVRDLLNRMETKDALLDYANKNFPGQKFHPNLGVPKLRDKIINLVDQFGSVE